MSEGLPRPDEAARIGRPPRLTSSLVVAEARRIGAEQGVEGLTMRRLADALGVAPNALYTYFPNKASILDAVLDDLLGDVERPRTRTRWVGGLVSAMSSYRRLLLTQPGLIALTVSRPMLGRNALRLREDMLTLLRRGALDDAAAVNAFLALFAYTTGFVAFEAARTPGQLDARQRDEAQQLYEALPDEDFPSTRALAGRLAKRPGELEFRRGLRAVIVGFAESGRG
jgi:TetR/AcrR family transcriptional regulator, tetracycline repressor protein